MNDADDHIPEDAARGAGEERKSLVQLLSRRMLMTGEIESSENNDDDSDCVGVSPQVDSQAGGAASRGQTNSLENPGNPVQFQMDDDDDENQLGAQALREGNQRGRQPEQEQRKDENETENGPRHMGGNDKMFETLGTESLVEESANRGKLIWCLAIMVVVAFAGGVVLGIAITKSSQDSIVDRTMAPTTTASATPSTPLPTQRLTASPSAPPSELILYDPPSEQDCTDIRNRDPVEGRENLTTKIFGIEFDVSVLAESEVETWSGELVGGLEENLVPALAGCSHSIERLLNDAVIPSMLGVRRLVNIRYVIADATVEEAIASEIDQGCQTGAPLPCYRLTTNLLLYLKGDERSSSLIDLVNEVVQPDDSNVTLVERLGLSSFFQSVVAVGVTNLNPTAQPSVFPSSKPSDQSSESPSMTTEAPSLLPTETPSLLPTEASSLLPTETRTVV